ncbi:MAG TPA: hypothetical protein VGK45_14975 [Thermoanaerobaculia bacterium]|jgi:lantibiotic modifying enzyme
MENLGGRWRNVHRAYGGELYSGTSGIALFLAYLHTATGERAFRRTALGAIHHALEHGTAQRLPWPCGTFGSAEVPGLMLGLAGIGYFYLRLADPDRIPSVLIPLPK